MKDLKNYQLITVKYIGATNTRGSRVKLTDTRFNNKSKYIPFNYSLNNINDMAAEYLTEQGFLLAGQCELGLLCDAKNHHFKELM